MVTIREAQLEDCPHIVQIYNHYIRNSTTTFEIEPIDGTEIWHRIESVFNHNLPYFVAIESAQNLVGYAYATKWRARKAYQFSVEISVYLNPERKGSGIGTALYTRLFEALRSQDIHTVIGGITLPNPQSIGLHEKFGMKKIAHFEEVGFKFHEWIDVGYWQGKL